MSRFMSLLKDHQACDRSACDDDVGEGKRMEKQKCGGSEEIWSGLGSLDHLRIFGRFAEEDDSEVRRLALYL